MTHQFSDRALVASMDDQDLMEAYLLVPDDDVLSPAHQAIVDEINFPSGPVFIDGAQLITRRTKLWNYARTTII